MKAWSQYIDNVLLSSITKNGANYEIASSEVTKAALQKALKTQETHPEETIKIEDLWKSYTKEMCEARWKYLQLMVSLFKL